MKSLPALTLELLDLIQHDRPAALAFHPGAVPRITELLRDVRALAERERGIFRASAEEQPREKLHQMKQHFATMASTTHNGQFYARYARMIVKHYGAHTAHGERKVRKPGSFRNVMKPDGRLPETYPTRKEALAAARAKAIQVYGEIPA